MCNATYSDRYTDKDSGEGMNQLTIERDEKYGGAWYKVGVLIQKMGPIILESNLFKNSPFSHNFILILSKLFRSLHDPYYDDNWKDIIGYCELILRYIEERENSP